MERGNYDPGRSMSEKVSPRQDNNREAVLHVHGDHREEPGD